MKYLIIPISLTTEKFALKTEEPKINKKDYYNLNVENISTSDKRSFKEVYSRALLALLTLILLGACINFLTIPEFKYIGTFNYEGENMEFHEIDMYWSSCGTDEYGKINLIEVAPSPINLNKNLTVSFDGEVFKSVTAPLKVEVKVQEYFLFKWFTLPCVDSVGSCTYEDICELSPYSHNSTCHLPLPNTNLPCKCPIEADKYYAHRTVIPLHDPAKKVPKFLKDGSFRVRVKGFQGDTNIGCYDFRFSVTS